MVLYAGLLYYFVDYVREIRLAVEGAIIVLNTFILFWLRTLLNRLVYQGFNAASGSIMM